MTKRPDDGGPAFPRAIGTDAHTKPCNVAREQEGMTLRDWFAGQLAANFYIDAYTTFEKNAQRAYAMADAMLAVRDREAGDE